MSIELIIVVYHRKGSFRAIIDINGNFTPGRNTTIIFNLAHVQCKKDNGDIVRNIFMGPIGDRLKYICIGIFLGCTHEDKHTVSSSVIYFSYSTTKGKYIFIAFRPHFYFTGELALISSLLEGRENTYIGTFPEYWTHPN